MGLGKGLLAAAGVYFFVTAAPSAQMEAKEPGSSTEYRQANATALHAGTESVSIAAQDIVTQFGPLMQSLTAQVQTGLSSLAPMVPPQATGTTLPTPVSP